MDSPLSKIRKEAGDISSGTMVLLFSGLFIVFINPALKLFRARCLFRELTGFYCAGCGMSTGLHSLLRGDFSSAIGRNILIGTAFPAALLYLVFRGIALSKSGNIVRISDRIIIVFFILLIAAFTICRNIPFPVFDILRPH